jgi:hypothetical protein
MGRDAIVTTIEPNGRLGYAGPKAYHQQYWEG